MSCGCDAPKNRHGNCAQCVSEAKSKRGRYTWSKHLKARYDMTLAEYDAMLARQGGHCALCDRVDARLCVDHCHSTGRIRGLLCHRCNGAIGSLGDDVAGLQRAIAYLLK